MSEQETGWVWNGALRQDEYPAAVDVRRQAIPLEPGDSSPLRSWLLDERNKGQQLHHLHRYFTADYTGKQFEWFIGQSDPTRFSPWDILAVESLSVSIPPATVRWLLEPDATRDGLLAEAHRSLTPSGTLWTCDVGMLRDGGPLADLYSLLRGREGLGPVTTSKLLAAKFPNVVPIRDSRVAGLLDMTGSKDWWEPMRGLFTGGGAELAAHLGDLELPAGIADVCVLRRLDVILWMEAKARHLGERESVATVGRRQGRRAGEENPE